MPYETNSDGQTANGLGDADQNQGSATKQSSKSQAKNKTETLKLSPEIYEILKTQADSYGIPPIGLVNILIERCAEGGDKKAIGDAAKKLSDAIIKVKKCGLILDS